MQAAVPFRALQGFVLQLGRLQSLVRLLPACFFNGKLLLLLPGHTRKCCQRYREVQEGTLLSARAHLGTEKQTNPQPIVHVL